MSISKFMCEINLKFITSFMVNQNIVRIPVRICGIIKSVKFPIRTGLENSRYLRIRNQRCIKMNHFSLKNLRFPPHFTISVFFPCIKFRRVNAPSLAKDNFLNYFLTVLPYFTTIMSPRVGYSAVDSSR